jgi:protein TonB
MAAKKIIILSIVFSIIIHALILSATGVVGMSAGDRLKDKAIVVDLQKTEDPEHSQAQGVKSKSGSPLFDPPGAAYEESATEETISLDSADKRYAPYLKKIKIKIEKTWSYPRQAFEQKKEGISMVRFSLDKRGKLLGNRIVSSSGYDPLDWEALNAIRASAPYEPFPNNINLSRLHIMASFRYQLLK